MGRALVRSARRRVRALRRRLPPTVCMDRFKAVCLSAAPLLPALCISTSHAAVVAYAIPGAHCSRPSGVYGARRGRAQRKPGRPGGALDRRLFSLLFLFLPLLPQPSALRARAVLGAPPSPRTFKRSQQLISSCVASKHPTSLIGGGVCTPLSFLFLSRTHRRSLRRR